MGTDRERPPGWIRDASPENPIPANINVVADTPVGDRAVGAPPPPTPDPWPKTPGGYDWPQCMQPIGPCRLPNGHGGPHAVGASEQPPPPLDVERLARALLVIAANTTGLPEADYDTDEDAAYFRESATTIAAEYARLGSTPSSEEAHRGD